MIRLTFACGHVLTIPETMTETPVCPCGERRVQRVKVRAPRFTGFCGGPCATFEALEPKAVKING